MKKESFWLLVVFGVLFGIPAAMAIFSVATPWYIKIGFALAGPVFWLLVLKLKRDAEAAERELADRLRIQRESISTRKKVLDELKKRFLWSPAAPPLAATDLARFCDCHRLTAADKISAPFFYGFT